MTGSFDLDNLVTGRPSRFFIASRDSPKELKLSGVFSPCFRQRCHRN